MSQNSELSAFKTVVDKLRRYIETEHLTPGQALPSERALTQRFKVSRHTLREAIRVLQEKGILTVKRGSGTYIADVSDAELAAALSAAVSWEKDSLFEIFQFREIFEPQIAALAATMANPGHIKQLNTILAQQAEATDPALIRELDSQFHTTLAYTTGNRIIADIVDRINEALSPARSDQHHSDERREKSLSGHRNIVSAIEHGSSDKAQSAMAAHIQDIKNAVIKTNR